MLGCVPESRADRDTRRAGRLIDRGCKQRGHDTERLSLVTMKTWQHTP